MTIDEIKRQIFIDSEEVCGNTMIDIYQAEEYVEQAYNKAIDDFKKMLTIEKIKEYAESDGFINLNNCVLMIFDIAEKLKVGGKNG